MTLSPEAYRSGPKKGLPKFCECGGNIIYVRDFNRWFSHCDKCTPVVNVNINHLKPKETTHD